MSNKVSFIFEIDQSTGQTKIIKTEYNSTSSESAAGDIISFFSDAYSAVNANLIMKDSKFFADIANIKFSILTISLDYAENLKKEKENHGEDAARAKAVALVQALSDHAVGTLGTTTASAATSYALAGLVASPLLVGGVVVTSAVAGGYLSAKLFDASGLKQEIGDITRNTFDLISNKQGSSIAISDKYITYQSGNQTLFTNPEDTAKQLIIDGILGNQSHKIEIIDPQGIKTSYSIQTQSTLSSIAQSLNTSIEKLLLANPWLQSDGRVSEDGKFVLIKSGEKILLPDNGKYLMDSNLWNLLSLDAKNLLAQGIDISDFNSDADVNNAANIFKQAIKDSLQGNFQQSLISSNFQSFLNSLAQAEHTATIIQRRDPLTLDLNHNGKVDLVAIKDSNTFFDLDNDGLREKVGWVKGDDGIVILVGAFLTKKRRNPRR